MFRCVAVAAACAIGAPAAHGDLIQFTFTGEIEKINGDVPAPWDAVGVGSAFEFSYVFDSEAEDQHSDDDIGYYSILSAEVALDGVAQSTTTGAIEVWTDTQEYHAWFAELPIGADGGLSLWGWPGTFDTDDLPLDLNLDDFIHPLYFSVVQHGGGWELYGPVQHFERAVIPTPPTLLALIALLGIQRPKRIRKI
jgi:hypothetical protein